MLGMVEEAVCVGVSRGSLWAEVGTSGVAIGYKPCLLFTTLAPKPLTCLLVPVSGGVRVSSVVQASHAACPCLQCVPLTCLQAWGLVCRALQCLCPAYPYMWWPGTLLDHYL